MQCAQRYRATGVEVRRLPDAARVAVALLAFELEGARRVVDAKHESVRLPGLQVFRQLELKRDVAPVVRAEFLAVEPGGGAPVGGADHEEDAPSLPRSGYVNRPGIPADGGAVGHAREGTPPRERHDDRTGRRQPGL